MNAGQRHGLRRGSKGARHRRERGRVGSGARGCSLDSASARREREREGAVGWRRGMTGGPSLSAGER